MRIKHVRLSARSAALFVYKSYTWVSVHAHSYKNIIRQTSVLYMRVTLPPAISIYRDPTAQSDTYIIDLDFQIRFIEPTLCHVTSDWTWCSRLPRYERGKEGERKFAREKMMYSIRIFSPSAQRYYCLLRRDNRYAQKTRVSYVGPLRWYFSGRPRRIREPFCRSFFDHVMNLLFWNNKSKILFSTSNISWFSTVRI